MSAVHVYTITNLINGKVYVGMSTPERKCIGAPE